MSKQETIETIVEILVGLTILVLTAVGVKYAFAFTWFQAAMIVYLVESVRSKRK